MTGTESQLLVEDVFKLSGYPTYTFVHPEEYGRLLVALRTPGRGVVIEGPSGIGKTTAVRRALSDLPGGDHALRLSARRAEDREMIDALPEMTASGTVVIDDFHRLGDSTRMRIADYLKLLADDEDSTTKIIVLGINRAGESLINMAGDLSGRLDVIRFETNSETRIRTLVHEGSAVFNVDLPEGEIARAAVGSFNLAQLICQSACLESNYRERPETRRSLTKSLSTVLEIVMDDLSLKFMELCMKFATGPRFSREGRAPYLHILQWLSEKSEWTLNLDREIRYRPELRGSVSQLIDRGHLSDFLDKNRDLSEVLHYDSKTHVLAVEDPRFFFFIKNLQWAKFAERVGYLNIGFTTRYDFALSFAGADRAVAEVIFERLNDREFSVFYDKNEQDRILAADVEEYLAPIYQTEAAFVLCLLSRNYPGRVWTKFESRQFRSRFGNESVVPIWFPDSLPSTFDMAGGFGGHVLDVTGDLEDEVERLVDALQAKLAEYRLQPEIQPGQFLCRRCRLILPMTSVADDRVSMCSDCAEKSKIY